MVIANIQKNIDALTIQIEKKKKQQSNLEQNQAAELNKIKEKYLLTDEDAVRLIDEKDNKIYNKIGKIVHTRWTYTIQQLEKVMRFKFI